MSLQNSKRLVLIVSTLAILLTGCQKANEVKDNFFSQFTVEEEEIVFNNEKQSDKSELRKTDIPKEVADDKIVRDMEDFYKEQNTGHLDESPKSVDSIPMIEESQEDKSTMIDPVEDYKKMFEEFLKLEKTVDEDEESTFEYDIVSSEDAVEFEEEEDSASTETVDSQDESAKQQVNQIPIFIMDSDMCPDVDDIFALSLLLGYDRLGVIDLQGVSLVGSRVRTVYAASALMHASKVYDIPIALNVATGIDFHSDYINEISNWPHSEDYVGDNLQLYNEIFFKNAQKINIICTGQVTQLYRLLNQPNGVEIIKQNVDKLYFVGTKYTGKAENNLWYGSDNHRDKVGPISKEFFAKWPTEIVFIPADTGGLMQCGQFLNTSDKGKVDILTQAKSLFSGGVYGVTAFDPFGCFAAVTDSIGQNEQHGLSYDRGSMYVHESGGSEWTPNPAGPHRRIILSKDNSYYQGQMNSILAAEFVVRTGKEVIW